MEMCEQELRSAVGMSGSNLKSGECEMPTIMVDSFFVVISFSNFRLTMKEREMKMFW